MNKKGVIMKFFDVYVFGNAGPFDEYNPYRIFESLDAQQVILTIAKGDFLTVNKETIEAETNLTPDKVCEIIKMLLEAQLISEDKGIYKIAFPFFIEADLVYIKKFASEVSQQIGDILIEHKNDFISIVSKYGILSNYGIERILYHVIGDKVFDGSALDYFANKNLFSISKTQPKGRDYLVIGYEKSEAVESFSNNLLCSSNNYNVNNLTFNSFGDSMGNRKDFYRYFRRIQSSVQSSTEHLRLNEIYNTFVQEANTNLMRELGSLIQRYIVDNTEVYSDKELEKLVFIEEMGYITIDASSIVHNVPIFTKELLDEISNFTLKLIDETIAELFSDLEVSIGGLSSVIHGVSYAEIGNELWHQVFGNINEYLVNKGFFQKLEIKEGEGRYLKAIYYWD